MNSILLLAFLAVLASATAATAAFASVDAKVEAIGPKSKSVLGLVSDAVDCGSASPDARFTIPQCTQGPCPFTKDVSYEVYPLFTASANIADIRVRVTLTHPGGVATIVDGVVAGANLQQGIEYRVNYAVVLPVTYEYQDAHLKFEVLDASNDRLEVCIGADVVVTEAEITDTLYLDVTIDGNDVGRVIVGLFGSTVPRTALNFATICTDGVNGRSYSGVSFHRVISNFMIQGGDIVNGDGTGSISIYGPQFDDENFILNHRGPGYLSMANAGPNTNGCQFFITTVVTPWLDGGYVVFGRVLRGQEFVHTIERNPTGPGDRPILPAVIKECGRIPNN